MTLQDNKNGKIFISVISHSHGDIISNVDCIRKLAGIFNVVIKSNTHDRVLHDYCNDHALTLIDSAHNNGFGFNNNYVFHYCEKYLGMSDDDYFVLFNPDVDMSVEAMNNLAYIINRDKTDVATINLFKNSEMTVYDNSVRRFPCFFDFLLSFVAGINRTVIDKSAINSPKKVDWCAGSFMAIKVSAFKKVCGFDTHYFMYCEDIDLCLRFKRHSYDVIYYPSIKAVHFARHGNRTIFSMHFLWHLKSIFRYILVKNEILKENGSLYKLLQIQL